MLIKIAFIIFLAIAVPSVASVALVLFIDGITNKSLKTFILGSGLDMIMCALISRGDESRFECLFIVSMALITVIACVCVLVGKIKNIRPQDSGSDTTEN